MSNVDKIATTDNAMVPPSLCDGDKVVVAMSKFGDGAFAKVDIKKGELVEHGLAKRIPVDGNAFEMCFTWSDNRDVWATCGGAAMFYNTSLDPNTEMTRFFKEDRFELHALRDIKAGEEMTHKYRSLTWRSCFSVLPQPNSENAAEETLSPPNSEPLETVVPQSKVVFDKVRVEDNDGAGARCTARVGIKSMDVVERGILRIAPFDGSQCSAAFKLGQEWAVASGVLMFYGKSECANVEVIVHDLNFMVLALRDIEEGEPLVRSSVQTFIHPMQADSFECPIPINAESNGGYAGV